MDKQKFQELYKEYQKAYREYKDYEDNFTDSINKPGTLSSFRGDIEKANRLWQRMYDKRMRWIDFLQKDV